MTEPNSAHDMRNVIIPKSDQLNSDDLIAGPITIRIRDVAIRPGTEQPCSIFYEGDGNKPFKPCKSMARVLVAAWGPDAKQYVGRSLTLYRDPSVKWAGMEIGGIRISHLSHIERDMVMALTATKGSRKPFQVKPLTAEVKAVKKAEQDSPKFELLTADGNKLFFDKLADYLTGFRLALSQAPDKAALWSDNAAAFEERLEAATKAGAAKAVKAMEEFKAEVNELLTGAAHG